MRQVLIRAWLGLVLAAGTCGLAGAGELAPRYEAMGEMTLAMDGQEQALVIPFDKEKGRAYAEQKMLMASFLTVNMVGRGVGEDGKPGRPMLQVTLQKRGGSFSFISAELFDGRGFDEPMVMGEDGAPGTLVAVRFEGDRIEAEIEGSFLRLTGYSKGEPVAAEGAEPVAARIRAWADLPPLK